MDIKYLVSQAQIKHLEGKSFVEENKNRINTRKYKIQIYSMFLYFEKVYGEKTVKWAYFFTQFWNRVSSSINGQSGCIAIAKVEYRRWKIRIK